MNEMRAVMFTISPGNVEKLHYDLCVSQNCRFVSRSQLIWVNNAADAECYI